MESVTLKALQFYRKDVQKRYDKIDAIVNGKHGAGLAEVYQQANGLMQSGIKTAADHKKLEDLAAKEKRLKADLKRSCDSRNTDKWCDLKIELEEIDREIANISWREGMRHG
ncbi:hypothetical protein [Marinomonas ostreistagni]|uniref:Uncharacterized protein n=1 Tax=Marinomonas ostreistagni TaxID=359209 RepID=A0ABS0ZAU8_9GAMM|nr:hypothetical protein [Marinomonas ostreistagni]MBJ7550767.1 hypothetical protein [Marinomonas ostreistagni]